MAYRVRDAGCSLIHCGVEGLIPVVSVRSHNVLIPIQPGLQTQHPRARHKPPATTHLPSLPLTVSLSVVEDERVRSLAAFSKWRAVIRFNWSLVLITTPSSRVSGRDRDAVDVVQSCSVTHTPQKSRPGAEKRAQEDVDRLSSAFFSARTTPSYSIVVLWRHSPN